MTPQQTISTSAVHIDSQQYAAALPSSSQQRCQIASGVLGWG
jgi:hypothetical protein